MREDSNSAVPSSSAVPAGILIFTDGACSGNPGPGGWGAIVAFPEGQIVELGGHSDSTTNNRMEILAVLMALKKVARREEEVHLFTDSTYVIRGITQWIWGWKKRGWKTAEGESVLNQDLWEDLHRVVTARSTLKWHYSRGHVGTPGNERVDEIAVAFSKKKWIDLYEGSLLQYRIPVYDLPTDTSLPEMKPAQPKVKAYSYLSFLGGEVWRHRDWPSCESRVKGRSGARFKKALGPDDEPKILAEWGLSATTLIRE
jgi:ribonuclease HI